MKHRAERPQPGLPFLVAEAEREGSEEARALESAAQEPEPATSTGREAPWADSGQWIDGAQVGGSPSHPGTSHPGPKATGAHFDAGRAARPAAALGLVRGPHLARAHPGPSVGQGAGAALPARG